MLAIGIATLFFFSADAGLDQGVPAETRMGVLRETVDASQEIRLDAGEILVSSRFTGQVLAAHMFGVVDARPERVWSTLTDINAWGRYGLPGLHESRLIPDDRLEELGRFAHKPSYKARDYVRQTIPIEALPRSRGKTWEAHAFQYYDFPWPVSDRWVLLKVSHDETRHRSGELVARWVMLYGNVKSVTGYFRLTPFKKDPERTLVSYHVGSDAGIPVPRFLVRYGTNRLLPKVVHALRREAKKL